MPRASESGDLDMVRPADDPAVDYKEFVKRAYDRCADAYAALVGGVMFFGRRQKKGLSGDEAFPARLP